MPHRRRGTRKATRKTAKRIFKKLAGRKPLKGSPTKETDVNPKDFRFLRRSRGRKNLRKTPPVDFGRAPARRTLGRTVSKLSTGSRKNLPTIFGGGGGLTKSKTSGAIGSTIGKLSIGGNFSRNKTSRLVGGAKKRKLVGKAKSVLNELRGR